MANFNKAYILEVMIKAVACPVCKSSRYETFFPLSSYKLARCKVCSMVWDPSPKKNLLDQYDKSYYVSDRNKGGYSNYFDAMKINSRTFYNRLKDIKIKTGKTGKLLDIGCAMGDCLLQAKKLGWKEVEGLDTSKWVCKEAKKRGLQVRCGTMESLLINNNEYAVVMSQDVIEHITDPVAELVRIYNALKPGGWVFLVTPEMDGGWLKLLKGKWYHYKPGEHVSYFSKKTMQDALKKAGFIETQTKATWHVMSLEYIFSRMEYYSPFIFGSLLKLCKVLGLLENSLVVKTGELEAWGRKPLK